MNRVIEEILNTIIDSGFDAYIVGGFVRDKILNINTNDIDICTSATPKDLVNIFKENIKVVEEYGSVKFKIDNYNIDITTFRRESDYKNNKPTKVEYIKELKDDLLRRDFTINAICLDKDGNIFDLLNGIKDLKKKQIKTVKKTKESFDEDATRILRALRFKYVYNFELSKEIKEYIKNNKEKLSKISYSKRKEELDKLFKSKNCVKFLNFIKKENIENYLGIKSSKFKYTNNLIGCWAQLIYDDKYNFTNIEKKQIKDIQYLINKGKIEDYDLYKYGNYICGVAAEILGISIKSINKRYMDLPIKSDKDIEVSAKEICSVLNIKPSKEIKDIYYLLENEILSGKIKNNKEEIISRLNIYEREERVIKN